MPFAGGTGIEGDPYLISTADDLNNVRNYLTFCFKQINDIDLSSYLNWTPITTFTGNYDGGGFNITGLTINSASLDNVGLFGLASGGEIKNLNLINVNITGHYYVGGLIGYSESNVTNCNSSGSVSGNLVVGGLIGYYTEPATDMKRCSSICTVQATTDFAGGLVGEIYCLQNVQECFAGGSVTGCNMIGGFVGSLFGGYRPTPESSYVASFVHDCYAVGNVTNVSTANAQVGGFVGSVNFTILQNCYSTGYITAVTTLHANGLIGYYHDYNISYVVSCYYDNQTSGKSDDNGRGIPKTTAEMKTQSTFISWDFNTIWIIDETRAINNGYPYFGTKTSIFPVYVKSNRVWKQATSGYVKTNGIWKELSSIKVKNNQTWN